MKVLITGAPGWLGTRFLMALCGKIPELRDIFSINEIEEVRCLVQDGLLQNILEEIHPKVKVYPGNLLDISSLEDFFSGTNDALLFHMAGIVHPHKRVKEFFNVNVKGSKNILELAVKNKVKKIVAISSNSPAGTNQNGGLFTEEMPYNPYMGYGLSKMQMEVIFKDAYKRGDIETVILRPCWFYGPNQPPRQTLFFTMIKKGSVPIVGNGENKRSMSYIDNTCQGMLLAGKSIKANGQTYWIADKKPYSMNEIVDTIEKLLEEEFKIKVSHKRMRLPDFASELAYGIDWTLQSLNIYHQKIHVLSEMNKNIACSVAKAQKELGYEPVVELAEGMRRSIKWCLEKGYKV